MRLSAPALTLVAFLGVAAALLYGGVTLARREIIERVERDRGLHYRLAEALAEEIQRLDALYDGHLAELTRPGPESREAVTAACKNLVGVRRFSQLSPVAGKDIQLDFPTAIAPSAPAPVFTGGTLFPGTPRRELPPGRFANLPAASEGWIEEADQFPLFYRAGPAGAVTLVTVDDDEVREAIDGQLRIWLKDQFEPFQISMGFPGPSNFRRRTMPGEPLGSDVRTEFDGVSSNRKTTRVRRGDFSREDREYSGAYPKRAVLVGANLPAGQPDWVLPVRGRFGLWRLESWDVRMVQRSWHMPTLVASGASAVLVALLGVFLAMRLGSAQRLAEQRVSFVNHVSHELRTPLMNMLLNADLTADLLEEKPDEARRRLSLLREEGQRLARLTDNVLTWSRRERGKLQLEPRPCDVEVVLGDVARIFEPLLARRAIALHRLGEPISGSRVLDPDALTQIVANLFSNVEKYAGREATLDFTVAADADTLTVTVADDGPGIPRGAEKRIFAPFERLDDSVNTGAAGAGLGLAIARDLATRLGGTLRYVRTERGACFELRVPAPVSASLPC